MTLLQPPSGTVDRNPKSQGHKRTEIGLIPKDWDVVTFGELGQCLSGGTPRKSDKRFWSGDIPWVSSKDMKVLRLSDAIDHVSELAIGNGTRLIHPGTILMVVRGMALAHSFPVAVVERALTFNQDLKAFVARRDVCSEFVLYWLEANQTAVLNLATEATHGTKRIPTADLLGCSIALPPLPEQRAIAEALSDIDRLITALDKLIAKKRAIKQGAMQELLSGKSRLPGFEVQRGFRRTEQGSVPNDWSVHPLRSCLRGHPAYGINAPAVAFDDRLPTYLRITDIGDDSRFRPSPRVSVLDPRAASFFLDEGDLVFARTGASVGKSYLYDPDDGPLVFAGFLVRVTPDPGILDSRFLAYSVQSKRYWDWVATMSVRSGQPGINSQELGTLRIVLPVPDEQRAIATVLSDMDAEIASLERRREKTRQIKQGMMQQLLTGRVRLVDEATVEDSEGSR
jgi:type I restriction enzyme S subunit